MSDYFGHFRYVWPNHPEKDATAVARYEQMGGQASPLGGEIGQESTFGPNQILPNQPLNPHVAAMPQKFRDYYLSLMGPVMPDSYASQR